MKNINVLLLALFIAYVSCTEDNTQERTREKYDNNGALLAADYLELGTNALDDYNKAIEYLTKAIELDPELSQAYSYRGFAKQNLKDYHGALADFNRAIRLDPNDLGSYINRGTVFYLLDDFNSAEADYIVALSKSRQSLDSASCYYNIGLAQKGLKKYTVAIQSFTKSVNLLPHNLPFRNRADCKFFLEDYRGAIKDYDQAILLDPMDKTAYYNRGLCKINIGRIDSGCLDLSKAGEMGYESAYEIIKDNCY